MSETIGGNSEGLKDYARKNPINYGQPEPPVAPFTVQRETPVRHTTPISFPMGLSVVTPDVSRAMEEVFVARKSNLTPVAEESPTTT